MATTTQTPKLTKLTKLTKLIQQLNPKTNILTGIIIVLGYLFPKVISGIIITMLMAIILIYMFNKLEKNNKNILIATDLGEMSNNELFLKNFFEELSNKSSFSDIRNVYIVFTNGHYTSNTTSKDRIKTFHKLFKEFNKKNKFTISKKNVYILTPQTLNKLSNNKYFNWMVKIGHLSGIHTNILRNIDYIIQVEDTDRKKERKKRKKKINIPFNILMNIIIFMMN